jgi:membrane protease YdiL (CAAX protease family)
VSVTKKSLVFLAITFAISWGVTLGVHFSGLKEQLDQLAAVGVLVVMMAGPAIAALICAFAFEKGRRIEALGLHFKPNWWWLWAALIVIALAAISVVVTLLATSATYVDPGAASRAAAEATQQDLSQVPPFLFTTQFLLLMTLAGILFNSVVLTITEELGWRGYLHDLWRPSGFWRASLSTGAIWGIWHAPAILFYGLNYPSHAEIGVGLFVIWCMLLSPIMTLIRDRGGSTWAAGIAHGTINAIAGFTIITLSDATFPWNGFVVAGGFVALALGVIVVFVLQRRAPAAT